MKKSGRITLDTYKEPIYKARMQNYLKTAVKFMLQIMKAETKFYTRFP